MRKRGGLTKAQRQAFIDANPLIKDWLRNKAAASKRIYAFHFIRFFQWAQQKYGFADVNALIADHEACRNSGSVQQKKRHARIVKEFVMDNPENAELGDKTKALIITAVSSFYNYCENPLSSATGEFKFDIYRKWEEKQPSIDDARRIISEAGQRERTIFLMMLQAGLRIGDLLNYVNYRWSEIKPQLDANKDPVKLVMYGGRYWTYISTDAIHELRKYIVERGEPKEGEAIFVSRGGKPVSPVYVADVLQRIGLKLGIIPESELKKVKQRGHRYPLRLHQFRKLFKSESSVAGRMDARYAEFFLGHAGGLAQIGGIYDKSPELHEELFEAEYKKLAPYLNVYTGVQSLEKRVAEIEKLKQDLGAETVERMRSLGIRLRKGVSKPTTEDISEPEKESEGNEENRKCEDGEHCGESEPEFKQIPEGQLLEHLKAGWRIIKEMQNGEVIVQRGGD